MAGYIKNTSTGIVEAAWDWLGGGGPNYWTPPGTPIRLPIAAAMELTVTEGKIKAVFKTPSNTLGGSSTGVFTFEHYTRSGNQRATWEESGTLTVYRADGTNEGTASITWHADTWYIVEIDTEGGTNSNGYMTITQGDNGSNTGTVDFSTSMEDISKFTWAYSNTALKQTNDQNAATTWPQLAEICFVAGENGGGGGGEGGGGGGGG